MKAWPTLTLALFILSPLPLQYACVGVSGRLKSNIGTLLAVRSSIHPSQCSHTHSLTPSKHVVLDSARSKRKKDKNTDDLLCYVCYGIFFPSPSAATVTLHWLLYPRTETKKKSVASFFFFFFCYTHSTFSFLAQGKVSGGPMAFGRTFFFLS